MAAAELRTLALAGECSDKLDDRTANAHIANAGKSLVEFQTFAAS
jgi:hypothetical protein